MAPHDFLRVTRGFLWEISVGARFGRPRVKMIYISGVKGSPNPMFMIPPIKSVLFPSRTVRRPHTEENDTQTHYSCGVKTF